MPDVAYPPVGFHFRVEFDVPGIKENDFRFREVSGLSVELDDVTHVEGGENGFVHRLPGRAKYPDLSLKRGLVRDSALTDWCRRALYDFDFAPTTVWVSLLNEEHEPLRTYTVVNAYPRNWSVSDFNAEASDVVIESLGLAYQYFRESEN